MRWAWAVAAAVAVGCGQEEQTPPPASGSQGGEQVVLAINVTGDGTVRGDGVNDCRAACTQRFAKGTHVKLTATPDSGMSFSGFSGACSGQACDLSLDADATVGAAFARLPPPPPSQHRLSVVSNGHGYVQSAPRGIDCGPTCSANFDDGAQVALAATADSGFTFGGWSGACSGSGACTVAMGADAQVNARFDAVPPPPVMVGLTVSVSGSGSVTGPGIDCPGTCNSKVAQGSTVALVPHAADGFRFMGFGGACSGGSCSFTANGDASVSAAFEQEVVVLVPADGSAQNPLGINSTHVFYWRQFNGSNSIWSVPKAGGTPALIANSGGVSYIVADDDHVYWSNLNQIWRAPATGGFTQYLYSGFMIMQIALDGGQLFWTTQGNWLNNNTYQSGGVHVGNASGGASMWLSTDAQPTGGVAVDSQYVYWSDQHAIGRVPRAGGASAWPIQCGACRPQVVRVDFDNIYYRNLDGDTWAFVKSTGAFHSLNTGTPRNNLVYQPLELDVNDHVAYWTWHDGTGSAMQGLFRNAADGSAFKAIETSVDASWYGLKVDDKYMYYFHDGALYRRLR